MIIQRMTTYKSLYRFFFLVLAFCAGGRTAQCQPPISTEQNYSMNSPGIVMVQAVFSATVYVNKLEMNEQVFGKLVDSVKRLDSTGTVFSPAQKLDIVIRALYK